MSTQEEKKPQKIEEIQIKPDLKDLPKGPTVFQALIMKKNRNVLKIFIFISASLVIVGFGTFFLGRELIPKIFPSISRYDSPIYACGLAVILTQAIVFSFYFWAWKHDVEEEKREKQKQD